MQVFFQVTFLRDKKNSLKLGVWVQHASYLDGHGSGRKRRKLFPFLTYGLLTKGDSQVEQLEREEVTKGREVLAWKAVSPDRSRTTHQQISPG